MILPSLKDPKFYLIALAVVSIGCALLNPSYKTKIEGYDLLVVVDVTNSMNVRDYSIHGVPTSRLDFVKIGLKKFLSQLPCTSNVALGIFAERKPFLLFEPINTCSDYYPLSAAIDALNWRMAWEGDSRISAGLFRAIQMSKDIKTDLIFLSDGHEAPPLPAGGYAGFEGKIGEVKGLIVGVGGYEQAPIPKYDDYGHETGFIGIDEVPHESRFGLPPQDAEHREGFNARNAPFGAIAATGSEHLSSVKERHLKDLSEQTGFKYFHLDQSSDLFEEYKQIATKNMQSSDYDIRPVSGMIGFGLVVIACMLTSIQSLITSVGKIFRQYLSPRRKNEVSA